MFKRQLIWTLFAGLLSIPTWQSCIAQSYPSRPVRIVIPYNPGGVVDYVGRALATQLGTELGQTIVSENRPGAGGIIGTDLVARERPDGYTLLIMDPAIVINPTLQFSIPYDLFKQLDTLSIISSSPLVLVAAPELNVKTFQEFVAYGRANPGKLNFASAGQGTTPHLTGEMFKQRTGIDAVHVPYRGIASSYADLMTNKIQFAFSSIAGALPFTSDNRVTSLATTGATRSVVYPDKPTIQEAGLGDFNVDLWLAVFAPSGMPAEVRDKLTATITRIVGTDEFKTAIGRVGAVPRGTSPDEAAAFVKSEYDKWRKIVLDGNLREK